MASKMNILRTALGMTMLTDTRLFWHMPRFSTTVENIFGQVMVNRAYVSHNRKLEGVHHEERLKVYNVDAIGLVYLSTA